MQKSACAYGTMLFVLETLFKIMHGILQTLKFAVMPGNDLIYH